MLRTFYLNWIRGKDKGFVIFKLINTTLGLLCKYVEVIWFLFQVANLTLKMLVRKSILFLYHESQGKPDLKYRYAEVIWVFFRLPTEP